MGGGDLGPGALAAERPGERDRLRRREGEIETGDRATAGDMAEAERLAARRMAAGQHRAQALGVDLAVESQVRGRAADPVPLRLTLAGVVVLGAFGDLLGVVALLAGAELPDREHQREGPPGGVDPSRVGCIPLLASGRRGCIGSVFSRTPLSTRNGGGCIGSRADSTTALSVCGGGCIWSEPECRSPLTAQSHH
jgi:hypothetical protein